jgi:hypothetical protein
VYFYLVFHASAHMTFGVKPPASWHFWNKKQDFDFLWLALALLVLVAVGLVHVFVGSI